MKLKTTEKEIQNSILDWLRAKKIFAWQNDTVGIYDPARKRFRINPKKMKGMADILIVHKGSAIAIEVKSATGRLSPEQQVFGVRFTRAGGFYCVARSIEDVEYFFNCRKEFEPNGF